MATASDFKSYFLSHFQIAAFSILSLFMIWSVHSPAQAQCGFNSIGDYVCAGNTGTVPPGGGGGGPALPGNDPSSIFTDSILPTLGGGPTSCAASGNIASLLGSLPPEIESAMTISLISTLSGSTSCDDISDILANLMGLLDSLASIPANPCGGTDITGNDVSAESIMSYVMGRIGVDLSFDLGPLSIDIGGILSDACSGPCGPVSGGAGGGGAPPGGSSLSDDFGNRGCTPVDPATIDDDIRNYLSAAEGVHGCWYEDTNGYQTIGIGHLRRDTDPPEWYSAACACNMTAGGAVAGGPQPECVDPYALYAQDIAEYQNAAESQMSQLGLNCHDFLVTLTSVNYQRGPGWRGNSPQTWSLMEQGRFQEAGDLIAAGSDTWHRMVPESRRMTFANSVYALEGVAPSSYTPSGGAGGGGNPSLLGSCSTGGAGSGGAGNTPPQVEPEGFWCPDAGAAAYATDSSLPGTYNLYETNPGRRIAESAMLSIGATTGDDPSVTPPGPDGVIGTADDGTPGGLGCALAVSRILRCAGYDFDKIISTDTLYDTLEADPCYETVGTGNAADMPLESGDILVTARNFSTGRAGHTGVYVGDDLIVSNSSSGFAGSDGQRAGGVKQNYGLRGAGGHTDWDSGVTSRNPGKSAAFRRVCP